MNAVTLTRDTFADLQAAISAAEADASVSDDSLHRLLQGAADAAWRRDYISTLEGMVDDLRGYDADADLGDAIHEMVDGSSYIIYTAEAEQVLRNSDNADAWETGDGNPECSTEQRAYFAMVEDLYEAIEDADGDASAETIGEMFTDSEE